VVQWVLAQRKPMECRSAQQTQQKQWGLLEQKEVQNKSAWTQLKQWGLLEQKEVQSKSASKVRSQAQLVPTVSL
jgi:hypothetical protein